MNQQSGVSSTLWEIPRFIDEDRTEEMRREKLNAYFAVLTVDKVTDQIITDYLIMAKSPAYFVSLGVKNISKNFFMISL